MIDFRSSILICDFRPFRKIIILPDHLGGMWQHWLAFTWFCTKPEFFKNKLSFCSCIIKVSYIFYMTILHLCSFVIHFHNCLGAVGKTVTFSLWYLMYIFDRMGNKCTLRKVRGQSSQLILSPQAGAAHRRGGGPSSLPPLHAAQREKGRSVNECTPESRHLLPPP